MPLDVPRELVCNVSRLLAGQRQARRTRRKTPAWTCWRQALFVPVWFCKQEDLGLLGAGFDISQATAYRYGAKGRPVLTVCAPELTDAQAQVAADG